MNVDRVAELQRWEESGAVWSLVSRTKHRVTIALLRCDGGEEVDRFTSDDPRLLEYVGQRFGSTDAVQLGKLVFVPVVEALELVGEPVRQYIERCGGDGLWVSEIDPDLADTQAFCEHYDAGLDISANCVVAEAKRADRVWHVACMVLATTRADINGIVRKHVDARKISFASMDTAVSLTGMEYGGITPIGLPDGWPILVDENVADQQQLIIGSGIRGSKLLASGDALVGLPGAEVLALTKA